MPTDANRDLEKLVKLQVDLLLRRDPIVDMADVIRAVAQNIGEAPDRGAIKNILDAHPQLVAAGINSPETAMYERGNNQGAPKRNFIGMKR